MKIGRFVAIVGLVSLLAVPGLAASSRPVDQTIPCEILVVGGGLAGTATAYEALLAGRTVCLTEITDWVGGQLTAQGTTALDEQSTQRARRFFSRGYLQLRDAVRQLYGRQNPGECWVSESCFLPQDGHKLLTQMLEEAARKGKGTLKWFPSTVVKDIKRRSVGQGEQIESVLAIQHRPAPGAPPLNSTPLSQNLEDWYSVQDSDRFQKSLIQFVPLHPTKGTVPGWYVVDATETGELIALSDVPYRVGIDARSHLEPSSSSETGDPYCTQAFTYTFAMEQLPGPQPQEMPDFYPQYAGFYSFEASRFNFPIVFTYRRIWSEPAPHKETIRYGGITVTAPKPGDISMQNWGRGNDYAPGTAADNLVYNRDQLQSTGQLQPGNWQGGLRVETLRRGEELARGYYYWLVAGMTDALLGDQAKQPQPNHRYLQGLEAPMGTVHGLSKYPYIREGRRIIGRPAWGHPQGFTVWEIDVSRQDYKDEYYQKTLSPQMYQSLQVALSGLEATGVLEGTEKPLRRSRSTIYPDSVGVAHYALDFHPCMTLSPPEQPGNTERAGERQGAGKSYPFQIPLRALIPQKLDNLMVAGKSIATSHIAAAAYRVHAFEWSSGAAVGTTLAYALEVGVPPYQFVDQLPQREPHLEAIQRLLERHGNPIAFPNTSIFNENWEEWR